MAAIIDTDFIRQHPIHAVLTVLGLSGVALIFLPFVGSEVPVVRFLDDAFFLLLLDPREAQPIVISILTLVGPLVLSFAISAGYLRWLFTGGLSRWESGLGYALALIGALGLPVYTLYNSSGSVDLFLLSLLVVYAANAWYIVQNQSSGTSPAPRALAAMQIVYLVFALYWLTRLGLEVKTLDEVYSGDYLMLVTVLVYTVQAALLVRRQRWKLLKLIPLALVWGLWVPLAWMG